MDQEIKDQFEKLDKSFDAIIANMFTKAEAEQLQSEMASKEDINRVLTAIDGLAGQTKKTSEELPAMQQQLRDMKDWILEAAPKIGIKYKG